MAKELSPKMVALIKALRAKNGTTAPVMRSILERVWAPTVAQLRPIADRTGYLLEIASGSDYEDGLQRYFFSPLAATKAAAIVVEKKTAKKATAKKAKTATAKKATAKTAKTAKTEPATTV